jgi:plasmid segregation protein ParM
MISALNGFVIRAVDVGYGNVKFTYKHEDLFSPVQCEIFPSRSPVASDKALSAGLLKGRDTVIVHVRGTDYEVGRGVSNAEGTFDESAVLHKDFCLSDAYLARLRGALYYMMGKSKAGDKYIDGHNIGLLVVGLPVANFRIKDLPQKLKVILTGNHELPDGRSVTVDNILVMPQPLGAFFEYAFDNDMFDTMKNQDNLIIDPGFFTFDWLVSSGLVINDARSDSKNRGVSAVLKAIAEAAKKKNGWSTDTGTIVRMLDDYFREGKPFAPFGNPCNVDDFMDAGKVVVQQAVSALANSVGDGADINNIIITGGGANLYKSAIQEKFPQHKILIMNNPVYSNVRGFQLAAEQKIIQQNLKARQSASAMA